MKLDERQTRMLHVLGASWLPMPMPIQEVVPTAARAAVKPASPAVIELKPPNVQSSIQSVAIHFDSGNLDWQGLNQGISSCTACALSQTRRNAVPGVGSTQAALMVLGEAPGDDEDALGEPFMGQAGQLLDNMLKAIGMGREQTGAQAVFITNTVKCQPPGKRKAAPEELAACNGFLLRQIQLLKPRVLLALGDTAARQTLGNVATGHTPGVTEPLGKLRGRVHHVSLGGVATQVIVSYHPSYLIRSPSEKARAWEDLCLLADTLEKPQT